MRACERILRKFFAPAPRRCILPFVLVLAAGCATPPRPTAVTPLRVSGLFPADALITQRAVLTARGRQFALNGYLLLSETQGMRLIVTGMVGQVLADVLVKRDGTIYVMRSSRIFRPAWIQRYLAADLTCIFGGVTLVDCPVKMVDPSHYLVERRWYALDLRIVETKPGPQAAELFDETRKPTR